VGQHLQYATGLGFIILPLGRVGIYQKILHHYVKIPVSHDTACKPLTTGVTYTVEAHSQGVGAVGLGRPTAPGAERSLFRELLECYHLEYRPSLK